MKDINIYGPGDDDYGRDKWHQDEIIKEVTNLIKTKMRVKAKFICNSFIPYPQYGNGQVNLHAVYGTEGENADYAKATPYGSLVMGIDDGTPAKDFFKQGKTYYLYFEEAPEKI